MSLDRQHDRLVMVCDCCGEAREAEDKHFLDFRIFMEAAKVAGWVPRKVGADWAHYCPDCAP